MLHTYTDTLRADHKILLFLACPQLDPDSTMFLFQLQGDSPSFSLVCAALNPDDSHFPKAGALYDYLGCGHILNLHGIPETVSAPTYQSRVQSET